MVRGRGEMTGREKGEEGEEGKRGGGRREKRGREEGEGSKKGREGRRGTCCAREARAAPEGRRETRGREGEVRGERPTPLSAPSYSLLRSCCDQLFKPIPEVATMSTGDPGERSWDVLARKSVAAIFFNMIKRMFATDLMADRSPAN